MTIVPAHTVEEGDTADVIDGAGFTVIVLMAVFVQPFTSVPVTVYVCVDAAVNATPFVTPPLHVYETPPVPFSVTAVPAHTVVPGDAVEPIVGCGFTVMVIVAVLLHPIPSVPVTVYVFVEGGVKATPFVTPPVHV